MKSLSLIFLISLLAGSPAVAQVKVSYDNAGNRIKRFTGSGARLAASLEFTIAKEYRPGAETAGSVLLKWSNTFQQGRQYFDVERSSDGQAWIIIGTLESAADSDSHPHYQHTDNKPFTGKNIYRLKITGSDQQPEYSTERMVEFSPLDHSGIYPNPVKDILFLQGLDPQNVSQVKINNQSGAVVQRFPQVSTDGIDVSRLPAGSYLLIIDSNAGDKKTLRFVKQ